MPSECLLRTCIFPTKPKQDFMVEITFDEWHKTNEERVRTPRPKVTEKWTAWNASTEGAYKIILCRFKTRGEVDKRITISNLERRWNKINTLRKVRMTHYHIGLYIKKHVCTNVKKQPHRIKRQRTMKNLFIVGRLLVIWGFVIYFFLFFKLEGDSMSRIVCFLWFINVFLLS